MARTKNVTRDISQKEVHEFNPRLKVNARPVDTFVPAQRSSRAQTFAQNLGLATQIGGQLSDIKQGADKQGAKEGHEAFLRGDETPEEVEGVKAWFTSQNVKRETFLSLKGQADVVKLTPALEELTATTASTAEATVALNKIRQDHVESVGGSIGYLEQFTPAFEQKAARVLTQVAERERKEAFKVLQDQETTLVNNQVDGILSSNAPVKDDGTPMTTQEILRDPEAYDEFTNGFNSVDTAVTLRQTLSEVQAAFKATGMTDKTEVSKFFVKTIAQRAIELGLPQLLDFTDIEDASNIKLSQVMKQEINLARKSAEDRQDKLETQTQKNQIKYRKSVEETVMGDFLPLQIALQQADQIKGTSARAQALLTAQGHMSEFLARPDLQEMGQWAPQKANFILSAQQGAYDLKATTPSPSLIEEGHKLWAEGRLTPEWVVTNGEFLGTSLSSFASRAKVVTDELKADAIVRQLRASEAQFSASALPLITELEMSAITVPDYGLMRKNRRALLMNDAFEAGESVTPEKLRDLDNQLNIEILKEIEDQLRRGKNRQSLDAGAALIERGKGGQLLGDQERKQIEDQIEDDPELLDAPLETPEDADKPPPIPVDSHGLDLTDPATQDAIRQLVASGFRQQASTQPAIEETRVKALEASNAKLQAQLDKLKKPKE